MRRVVGPILLAVALLSPVGATIGMEATASAQGAPAIFAGAGLARFLPVGDVVGDGTTPVTISFLALNPDGTPILGVKPRVTATEGDVLGFSEVGGGLYQARFIPPLVETARTVTIRLRGKNDAKAAVEVDWEVRVEAPTAQAVEVAANPDRLILGQDTEATLTIQLIGGSARPEDLDLTASSGTIENLTDMGGGKFTARFVAPKVNYPHMSIISVADKRDPSRTFATEVIALNGKTDYPVKAPPGASVILRISGREFGPVTAASDGQALVPVIVPPGESMATLVSVSGGISNEESLDLRIPETKRMRILSLPTGIPADSTLTVPIRVAVRNPDGTADTDARPSFVTSAGAFGSVRHDGDGIYVADFTPPTANVATSAKITISIAGSAKQTDERDVVLVPARAAKIELTAEPLVLGVDSTGLKVFAKVLGPDLKPLSGRELVFLTAGAKLKAAPQDLRNGDYRADLATTGGAVQLVASVHTTGTGMPLRRVLVLPARPSVVNDGASVLYLTVVTVDRFGHPVPNTRVDLAHDGDGTLATAVTTDADGLAQITYTAGRRADLVAIIATSGDHVGAVGVLQAPASVAIALPTPGSESLIAAIDTTEGGIGRLRVEREGSIGVAAGPITASVPAASIATIQLLADAASVAAGSSIVVRIKAVDAAGHGVAGQAFDTVASAGRFGPITDEGGGAYSVTLTVPADATTELKLSIASADGGTASFLKIPITKATGASTPPVAPPAPVAPVPVPPITPVVTPIERPPKVERPPADGEDPWLRASLRYVAASYRYDQRPTATPGPLLPVHLAIGGAAGGKPAYPQGFEVHGRAFLPSIPYLGADLTARFGYYAITAPEFQGQIVRDTLLDLHVDALGRYPFQTGPATFHVGARVGFGYSDFIVFRGCLETGCTVLHDRLPLPGVEFGAEFGAEIGEFHFVGGLKEGLYYAIPYRTAVDVTVGYAITPRWFVDAAFEADTRRIRIIGDESGIDFGTITDGETMGKIGFGYSM